MNTVSSRRLGPLAAGLVGILLALPAVQAQVPCQYEVTIIQAPECPFFGWPPTWGRGLNDDGALVGYHWACGDGWGDFEAFVWTPETGMVDLPRPPGFTEAQAWDIEGNQIVGGLRMNNVFHAVLWQDGQVTELGTMPGGNFSEARAISPDGRIVGTWGNSATGDPGLGAFLWQDGLMINIHTDLGTPLSVAQAITVGPQGVRIVGWMGNALLQDSQAYIWNDGKVTALPNPPGMFAGRANGIGANGETVVGAAQLDDGSMFGLTRAVMWKSGSTIVLGTLPGLNFGAALDVNDDASVIVGVAWSPGSSGFIWHKGTMTDLNDLMPPGLGVHITSAWEINDSGQIAAEGAHPEFGAVGILLTPAKRALGDLDGDGTVGILDLLILLASWGPCPDPPEACPGDLDADAMVGILDLLTLLANWGPCP